MVDVSSGRKKKILLLCITQIFPHQLFNSSQLQISRAVTPTLVKSKPSILMKIILGTYQRYQKELLTSQIKKEVNDLFRNKPVGFGLRGGAGDQSEKSFRETFSGLYTVRGGLFLCLSVQTIWRNWDAICVQGMVALHRWLNQKFEGCTPPE